ncbi:unnamed protein product [Leuciscus chuanchicus]
MLKSVFICQENEDKKVILEEKPVLSTSDVRAVGLGSGATHIWHLHVLKDSGIVLSMTHQQLACLLSISLDVSQCPQRDEG